MILNGSLYWWKSRSTKPIPVKGDVNGDGLEDILRRCRKLAVSWHVPSAKKRTGFIQKPSTNL
jgi:hypothetical protein